MHAVKLSILHINTSKAIRVKSFAQHTSDDLHELGGVLDVDAGERVATWWKAPLLPGTRWLLPHAEQAF